MRSQFRHFDNPHAFMLWCILLEPAMTMAAAFDLLSTALADGDITLEEFVELGDAPVFLVNSKGGTS